MTSDRANYIFLDYIENIDKVEAELGRKLSKEEIIENIYQEFIRISDLESKAVDRTFEKQGYNINKPGKSFNVEFTGDANVKAHVQTLTESEREKKIALRNQLFRSYITSAYESREEKEKEVLNNNYYGGPTRNTQALLGNHVVNSETNLKGTDVGKSLQENKLSSAEKQNLFSNYIDGVAKETSKIAKECISDSDYLSKLSNIAEAGKLYSVDNVAEIYEGITKEGLSKETKAKYLADKEILQTVWTYSDYQFAKIADPLYIKVTGKSQKEISRAAVDANYYDSPNVSESSRNDERVQIRLKFGSSFNTGPISKLAETEDFHMVSSGKKLFAAVQTRMGINDKTPLYGADGKQIDLATADKGKLLFDNKVIVARGLGGKDYFVSMDRKNFVQYKEIPERTDNRDKYKEMLNILNSGTRRTVRSSKEYKNMRNILGQLIEGKQPEQETALLGKFEENMNKYMENFDGKAKKSEIAYIRKDCVDKVKNMFGDMYLCSLAQDINEPYKGKEDYAEDQKEVDEIKATEAKEESGPVRQSIVIEEAKDKANSEVIPEEKQEEKALAKENEKEAEDDYYEEQAPMGEGVYQDDDDYIDHTL